MVIRINFWLILCSMWRSYPARHRARRLESKCRTSCWRSPMKCRRWGFKFWPMLLIKTLWWHCCWRFFLVSYLSCMLAKALKTYNMYHTDCLIAEGKLKEAERLEERHTGKSAELGPGQLGGQRRSSVKKMERLMEKVRWWRGVCV